MDYLPDSEIKDIWGRIKKYIDPSQIKSNTREGFVKELTDLMESAGAAEGKQGSLDTLIKHGFPDRVSTIPDITQKLPGFAAAAKQAVMQPPGIPKMAELPPKLSVASNNRFRIETGRGTRYYSQKNIRLSYSLWKDKAAFWVYNTRTKKRVSWGLY